MNWRPSLPSTMWRTSFGPSPACSFFQKTPAA